MRLRAILNEEPAVLFREALHVVDIGGAAIEMNRQDSPGARRNLLFREAVINRVSVVDVAEDGFEPAMDHRLDGWKRRKRGNEDLIPRLKLPKLNLGQMEKMHRRCPGRGEDA